MKLEPCSAACLQCQGFENLLLSNILLSFGSTAKQAWLMRKMTRQRQSLDRKGDAIVLQL